MAEIGEPLSDRELAVLESLADGSTNREIAQELDISHNTVKVHLRNIFVKLGVSSRTEAATVAMQQGLLSMPGGSDGANVAAASEPDTFPASIPDQIGAGESSQGQGSATTESADPTHWRSISFALFLVIVLLVGTVAGSRLLGDRGANSGQSAETVSEQNEEVPMADSDWLIGTSLPQERANMALAAVGLNLYQIGGEVSAGVVNLVDVYETDARQWRSGAPKPTAVADASAVVLFGEIYVPGGRLADGQPTSVVEAYSPAKDAWRPVTPLPQPVSGGLALSDGSRLYLFGGWDGQQYIADSYVFDPGTDAWRALPAMSHARGHAAGGVIDNQPYVVGGLSDEGELAVCETFNQLEGSWSDCPDMLLPRGGAGAAVLDNNLLFVVGGGINGEVGYGEVYDSRDRMWEQLEMPMLDDVAGWYHLGVANVETRIYALGGRQNDEIVSANYIYAPLFHQTFLPAVGGEN